MTSAPDLRRFYIAAAAITLAFALPLYDLVRHALRTEIQSHILLIPFIFWYLLRIDRSRPVPQLSTLNSQPAWTAAVIAALLGGIAVAAYLVVGRTGNGAVNDALSISTGGYLLLLLAAAFATIGSAPIRGHLFAVCFLVFLIPLPLALTDGLSIALQHASAEVSEWLFTLTAMPFFRDGMEFKFAGLSIRVAEECSGVRSTFVLFITSLLAGHIFLRTPWKKALLAAAIFPLGILRNAFRITTISWLTVNVDAGIIDGPLHHRGGPVFFAFSLLPLFALLWVLVRSDSRTRRQALHLSQIVK